MVNRCSNADCRAELKALNGGDLYALERRSADTEFFWLCSACARKSALYLDPTGCISVRVWSIMYRAQPPHPDCNLRLISRSIQPTPRLQTLPASERAYSFAFGAGPFSSDFSERGGI